MTPSKPYKLSLHKFLTIGIILVWLINGLFCKLLNLVPRHQQIVAYILGEEHVGIFTKAIGLSEVLMCVWIISGLRSRFCAVVQIIVVMAMNIIEFFMAPDLLLFGKGNIMFATLLAIIIYLNEFVLNKEKKLDTFQ